MVKNQNPSKVHGIWCRKNKTFYYLESGHIGINHPVDRVKKVLMRRGLLNMDLNDLSINKDPYKVMTWADAIELTYPVEVLYLNSHIRQVVTADNEATATGGSVNPWAK